MTYTITLIDKAGNRRSVPVLASKFKDPHWLRMWDKWLKRHNLRRES